MASLKHHIIFHNYYSSLNDILEEKIHKIRFSTLCKLYTDEVSGSESKMSVVEYRLRMRKLEIEEEMEYHEEMFIDNFESGEGEGYKEYSKKDIMDYVKIFKEKVSSKIYNHNYKIKN